MSILVISATLGEFDRVELHEKQSLVCDYFNFNDNNFPVREKAITKRLQAKIPKMFGWQLKPGYDYYLWIDGNLKLSHKDAVKYFYDNCQDVDVVVMRHPYRPNIRQEARYLRKGLREQSLYLVGRYAGEWTPEQVDEINLDKDYADDLLVIGGVFMYRNTPAVQAMLKEWWYFTSRYSVFDQLSFAYVLKKSGLKLKILEDQYNKCKYLEHRKHKHHDR